MADPGPLSQQQLALQAQSKELTASLRAVIEALDASMAQSRQWVAVAGDQRANQIRNRVRSWATARRAPPLIAADRADSRPPPGTPGGPGVTQPPSPVQPSTTPTPGATEMAITTPTTAGSPERLQQDTEALLRMVCKGGTLGGLFKLSADELEALYAFGLSHYAQGRYAESMKVFSRLVTLHHGETRYYNALAASHQMLGHHERAVHYWGVSQLLDASDPAPTFHTANSLLALGLVDDALDALDLVVTQCQRQDQHPELAARAEALRVLVRSKKAAA